MENSSTNNPSFVHYQFQIALLGVPLWVVFSFNYTHCAVGEAGIDTLPGGKKEWRQEKTKLVKKYGKGKGKNKRKCCEIFPFFMPIPKWSAILA